MAALWGISGVDPRRTLLAVLVQGEVTAAAAGDIEAAAVAHDAAGQFLKMTSEAEEGVAAARAAHRAVEQLLRTMKRR